MKNSRNLKISGKQDSSVPGHLPKLSKDRVYVEEEKARIAAATALAAEKAADREAKRLQKAKEAKEHAEVLKTQEGVLKLLGDVVTSR